ncbi:MAG: hypothetical protein KF753_04965 [Caldilineaceae bacterium]|nr:hypothetical protein [Caldilineaceae bacterium]
MNVHFADRNFSEPLHMQAFRATVDTLAWVAQGGPKSAQLTVTGPALGLWGLGRILRYGVEIANDLGDPIWWGYVAGVEINVKGVTFGLSLDRMSNSIAVAYMTPDGETYTTAFLADNDSVDTYGTKQLLLTADNVTAAAAEQRRANELNRRRLPIVTPPYSAGNDDGQTTISLDCRGWYDTLDWRYYSRDEGRVEYLPTSEYPQKLGLGFASSAIGFEAGTRHLSEQAAKLINLRKGDTLRIAGSGTNDGVYTVEQGTEQETASYTALTISFDAATREVRDSANGLGAFDAHDMVLIAGSASNNGYQRIESSSADGSKFVVVGTLTNEAAGATVTLSRGHSITVEETLVDELPGASITLTALGTKVAQSFEVDSGDAWTAATAAVKVRRVGNPSDNLVIAIYSDSSGSPGSLLDSSTVAGSAISADGNWTTVELANTQSLVPGTTYWLMVSRDGANTYSDYYEVMVDPDLGYAPEVLKIYDGSGWVSRPENANMPFRLTGLEDTNTQMETLITAAAEFIVRNEVAASGTETNQWRNGDNTALVELESLLSLGTSNNRRMLARVTRERTLIITEEQAKPDTIVYFQNADGGLVDRNGVAIVGYPPMGEWIDLKGVIPDSVQLSELLRPAPYLLERAEYRVDAQEWRLDARDTESAWDFAAMREG